MTIRTPSESQLPILLKDLDTSKFNRKFPKEWIADCKTTTASART